MKDNQERQATLIPHWLIKGLSDGNRLPCFMPKGSLVGHISLDRDAEKLIFIPLLDEEDDG